MGVLVQYSPGPLSEEEEQSALLVLERMRRAREREAATAAAAKAAAEAEEDEDFDEDEEEEAEDGEVRVGNGSLSIGRSSHPACHVGMDAGLSLSALQVLVCIQPIPFACPPQQCLTYHMRIASDLKFLSYIGPILAKAKAKSCKSLLLLVL